MGVPVQSAGVVVDPDVPQEIAGAFRANGLLLSRVRAGWRPAARVRQSRSNGSGVSLGLVLPVAGAFSLVFLIAGARIMGLVILGLMLLLLVLKLGWANSDTEDDLRTPEQEFYDHARRFEGRFYLPEDFDRTSLGLLARAQGAIATVLHSHVNAEGLLDDVRNAVMLPQQEWEIARLLAKLSALRTEHRQLVAGGMLPEVARVVEPLERALQSSEEAVVTRIEALERYARHVSEAERAFHAHRQIDELRARLPRYEELLAESGADGSAVPEIAGLADDAGDLEQALRKSIGSAHDAFRHLEG
ncbi:hypothetical protein [Nonomuraea sp. NPDC046570]|uniref:hypothetical protein n=1 Tax=Nonomuraea sp. NPDC046570 TaxID=3155255 RepID=UPI0034039B83